MLDEYSHRCADAECPCFKQETRPSCRCHQTREQMMLAEIKRLRAELDKATRLRDDRR